MKFATFVKWSGNKSRYAGVIKSHMPEEFDRYIEPFLGSGAMFLSVKPDKYIINDMNRDCMDMWRWVKDDVEGIIRDFKAFGAKFKKADVMKKTEMCKKKTLELAVMERSKKRTSQFMLMKYCAYMGHIFVNNKYVFYGIDGTIYSRNRMYFLSDKYYEVLREVSAYLNESRGKGNMYCGDYAKILAKAKRGDFVFLDPPYMEKKNYKFNYNKNEKIDDIFISKLRDELKKLDDRGVKWLMTQADTPEVRMVFRGYNTFQYEVFRAQAGVKKNELIIKNY